MTPCVIGGLCHLSLFPPFKFILKEKFCFELTTKSLKYLQKSIKKDTPSKGVL